MKFAKYLTEEQVINLKYEVLSNDLQVYLTRHLNGWCEETDDVETTINRKNRLINFSRIISGEKIYTLTDDLESIEFAWHDASLLLIFRKLDTIQFIEFVCDLITYDYFRISFINDLLEKDGSSFRVVTVGGRIGIEVFSIEEIEETNAGNEHPNVRTLVARMDNSFEQEDFASVLHSSASIFETMAKDIIGIPGIQDQTLKSFFDRYRQESGLPDQILDFILVTYDQRNTTSLAGHGGLTVPEISREQAIVLCEMTKAFVRIEYRLQKALSVGGN